MGRRFKIVKDGKGGWREIDLPVAKRPSPKKKNLELIISGKPDGLTERIVAAGRLIETVEYDEVEVMIETKPPGRTSKGEAMRAMVDRVRRRMSEGLTAKAAVEETVGLLERRMNVKKLYKDLRKSLTSEVSKKRK